MENFKILIIDDDLNICELIRLYLEKNQFICISANDGKKGIELFKNEKPDLVLLDIMLPIIDGWQVCREIRKDSKVPVIMLTAKGETFDKILGFELGADDYISKPYDSKELMYRIKAVLKRCYPNEFDQNKIIKEDKLEINLSTYQLIINGIVTDAPPKEMELLFKLASNPNQVFTRDQLLDEVWGFDYYGDSRTVDVHIKRLREKLEGVSQQWALKTVWGVGYKFEVSK